MSISCTCDVYKPQGVTVLPESLSQVPLLYTPPAVPPRAELNPPAKYVLKIPLLCNPYETPGDWYIDLGTAGISLAIREQLSTTAIVPLRYQLMSVSFWAPPEVDGSRLSVEHVDTGVVFSDVGTVDSCARVGMALPPRMWVPYSTDNLSTPIFQVTLQGPDASPTVMAYAAVQVWKPVAKASEGLQVVPASSG
jgi:hypothetical protein